MDAYEVLGVSIDATDDKIKLAYRKLSSKHHPDKAGGSEEEFKRINNAYRRIATEQLRLEYENADKPYTIDEQACNIITNLLEQILESNAYKQFDYSSAVKESLKEGLKDCYRAIDISSKIIEKNKIILETHTGSAIEKICNDKILELGITIQNMEKNIEVGERAIELVDDVVQYNPPKATDVDPEKMALAIEELTKRYSSRGSSKSRPYDTSI